MGDVKEEFDTTIVVKEAKLVYTGTVKHGSNQGREYQIHQLIAETPEGVKINWNLRTFEQNFPLNRPVEVHCKLFKSPDYGDSFTVEQKEKSSQSQADNSEIKALTRRVEALERTVAEIKDRQAHGPSLYEQAQAAGQRPETQPAPPPVPVPSDGLASDDDIPF